MKILMNPKDKNYIKVNATKYLGTYQELPEDGSIDIGSVIECNQRMYIYNGQVWLDISHDITPNSSVFTFDLSDQQNDDEQILVTNSVATTISLEQPFVNITQKDLVIEKQGIRMDNKLISYEQITKMCKADLIELFNNVYSQGFLQGLEESNNLSKE